MEGEEIDLDEDYFSNIVSTRYQRIESKGGFATLLSCDVLDERIETLRKFEGMDLSFIVDQVG